MRHSSSRRSGLRVTLAVAVVLLAVAAATAYPFVLSGFESHYPTTTIPDYTESIRGDRCLTCHVSTDRSILGNAYRVDLIGAFLDYNTIDTFDSDGDGVDNQTEATTPRVDPPMDVSGASQTGYNPGLIDCPNGLLGYDPFSMRPITGVHETPVFGIVWTNEIPGINCADLLDNDCDGLKDDADPDCSAGCAIDDDCDDGVFCNGAETCDGNGMCQSGTPPVCDDMNSCTADGCDMGSDSCLFVPVGDGTACSTGDFCLVGESCQGGVCADGLPRDCGDANDCTVDSCDSMLGSCVNQAPPVPGEIGAVSLALLTPGQPDVQLDWPGEPDATGYNLYRGDAPDLSTLACADPGLATTSAVDPAPVGSSGLLVYLVTAANCSGESTLGDDSSGMPRAGASTCP